MVIVITDDELGGDVGQRGAAAGRYRRDPAREYPPSSFAVRKERHGRSHPVRLKPHGSIMRLITRPLRSRHTLTGNQDARSSAGRPAPPMGDLTQCARDADTHPAMRLGLGVGRNGCAAGVALALTLTNSTRKINSDPPGIRVRGSRRRPVGRHRTAPFGRTGFISTIAHAPESRRSP